MTGACGTDADCDDRRPCTMDVCDTTTGMCRITPMATCECRSATNCDDGRPCTVDVCSAGVCRYSLSPLVCPCTSFDDCWYPASGGCYQGTCRLSAGIGVCADTTSMCGSDTP